MDPLSQGLVGAVVSQTVSKPEKFRLAFLVGFLSSLLADLDILIRSSEDPILSLEYHRHFTHSLVFVPLGGLIGGTLTWMLVRDRLNFKERFTFATLGFLTAGPLDACTSYGTHLYWPFSDERTAWHLISIIDPIFTGTILSLSIIALIWKRKRLCNLAVVFGLIYLSCGAIQLHRAENVALTMISQREHQAERLSVKPSIGNILLWRSIYRHGDDFYIDAILVHPFSEAKTYRGGKIGVVNIENEFSKIPKGSVLREDIARFAFFSDYYLSFHPNYPNVLGDMRYATLPNSIEPLWGVEIDSNKPDQHVKQVHFRSASSENWQKLRSMLLGE